MNSDQLKNLQQPLKQKYKEEPASALITLKAMGRIGEGVTCRVETGKAIVEAGLHPATGGTGMLACSGDLLLEALVACAGVTLSAVATSIGIEIKSGKVFAEGDLDFRGTLAVDKEASVGFKSIRLSFQLQTDEDEEKIRTLLKLTERYCVVYQTLVNATSVFTSYTST
jgi:uncharacterized OsmC-like protein